MRVAVLKAQNGIEKGCIINKVGTCGAQSVCEGP